MIGEDRMQRDITVARLGLGFTILTLCPAL